MQWYGKLGNASGANESVVPMPDPLSAETLARMKAEHVAVEHHATLNGDELPDIVMACVTCFQAADGDVDAVDSTPFPCDAALLLAELERVQAPAELAKTWWNGFPSHSDRPATTLWDDDE